MRAVRCVMCAFFVICVLDITKGRDFNEIISNLPSDITNVIINAWKGVLKAIKSPIRPRRLGRIKLKNTTVAIFDYEESSETVSTLLYVVTTDAPRRPSIYNEIPFITKPEWKSLLDWRILQRPDIVKFPRGYRQGSPSVYESKIDSYEESTRKLTTTINEEDNFGLNTKNKEDPKEQSEILNIPVITMPDQKYDYNWASKFRTQPGKATATTSQSTTEAVSDPKTFTTLTTQLSPTTEQTLSLLKQLQFASCYVSQYYYPRTTLRRYGYLIK